VDVVKRLADTPAGAHQLDDPAGAHPALSNGVSDIAGTQRPAHLAAMAGLNIADLNREVPVPAEQGNDLLIQPALVLFDRQEQVGALLGGELKNTGEVCSASAWISTPSRSRLLSKVFFEGRALVGFAGVKGVLRDRHTQLPRIERDLGDKPRCAIRAIGLRGRAPQCFAITDQLIKILVLICDLSDCPLPEQPEERLELHPLK
jgi:hypothetical protein